MTAQVIEPSFNLSTAEAFAERLLGIINSGALSLMISVGHRTQLFNVLAELPAAINLATIDLALAPRRLEPAKRL